MDSNASLTKKYAFLFLCMLQFYLLLFSPFPFIIAHRTPIECLFALNLSYSLIPRHPILLLHLNSFDQTVTIFSTNALCFTTRLL